MVETVREHCQHKDCKYRSAAYVGETCDYMLVTGKPRNCNISVCDKYESGERVLKSTLGGFIYDNDI